MKRRAPQQATPMRQRLHVLVPRACILVNLRFQLHGCAAKLLLPVFVRRIGNASWLVQNNMLQNRLGNTVSVACRMAGRGFGVRSLGTLMTVCKGMTSIQQFTNRMGLSASGLCHCPGLRFSEMRDCDDNADVCGADDEYAADDGGARALAPRKEEVCTRRHAKTHQNEFTALFRTRLHDSVNVAITRKQKPLCFAMLTESQAHTFAAAAAARAADPAWLKCSGAMSPRRIRAHFSIWWRTSLSCATTCCRCCADSNFAAFGEVAFAAAAAVDADNALAEAAAHDGDGALTVVCQCINTCSVSHRPRGHPDTTGW